MFDGQLHSWHGKAEAETKESAQAADHLIQLSGACATLAWTDDHVVQQANGRHLFDKEPIEGGP